MTVAAVIAGLALCGASALAHKGATGVIKERMDAMEVMAAEMKALAAMVSKRGL
jgi:Na+(H+)/acetate symporter ActP